MNNDLLTKRPETITEFYKWKSNLQGIQWKYYLLMPFVEINKSIEDKLFDLSKADISREEKTNILLEAALIINIRLLKTLVSEWRNNVPKVFMTQDKEWISILSANSEKAASIAENYQLDFYEWQKLKRDILSVIDDLQLCISDLEIQRVKLDKLIELDNDPLYQSRLNMIDYRMRPGYQIVPILGQIANIVHGYFAHRKTTATLTDRYYVQVSNLVLNEILVIWKQLMKIAENSSDTISQLVSAFNKKMTIRDRKLFNTFTTNGINAKEVFLSAMGRHLQSNQPLLVQICEIKDYTEKANQEIILNSNMILEGNSTEIRIENTKTCKINSTHTLIDELARKSLLEEIYGKVSEYKKFEYDERYVYDYLKCAKIPYPIEDIRGNQINLCNMSIYPTCRTIEYLNETVFPSAGIRGLEHFWTSSSERESNECYWEQTYNYYQTWRRHYQLNFFDIVGNRFIKMDDNSRNQIVARLIELQPSEESLLRRFFMCDIFFIDLHMLLFFKKEIKSVTRNEAISYNNSEYCGFDGWRIIKRSEYLRLRLSDNSPLLWPSYLSSKNREVIEISTVLTPFYLNSAYSSINYDFWVQDYDGKISPYYTHPINILKSYINNEEPRYNLILVRGPIKSIQT